MSDRLSGKAGLFYPHIHFRSRDWLRASILYYDRLARIVPQGLRVDQQYFYEEFLSEPDARALLDDIGALKTNGYIVDESPEPYLADVATEFSTFLTQNLRDPAQRAKLIPALATKATVYAIHPGKIDSGLRATLHDIGVAHRTRGDEYSDLEIEGVTAAFYMLHLANKMVGRRSLVTDSSIYQSLMYQKTGSGAGPRGGRRDQELRLATAVFETAIPTGLASVPIDKLLKVQYDLLDQRRRFQDKVAALAKSIEHAESDDELAEKIDSQARKLEDEQAELVDKLRSAQLTFATGLFSVSVPAWVTAPWGLGQTALTPLVMTAGAVALSAVAIKSIFDQRSAKRTNAMTYVLNVRKRLKPAAEANRIVSLNLRHPARPQRALAVGGGGRRRFRRRLR